MPRARWPPGRLATRARRSEPHGHPLESHSRLAAWPPGRPLAPPGDGRMAAWPPGRLAAWPLAAWPPGAGRLALAAIAWRYWLAWPVAIRYGGGGVLLLVKSYGYRLYAQKAKLDFSAQRLCARKKRQFDP